MNFSPNNIQPPSNKQIIYALLLYLLFFLALFLQFPLSSSLTGDLDTISNLAMFHNLGNKISSFWTGISPGTSNYPVENFWAAFGFDFLSGIVHLFFNALGIPDLWAYYLYITIIFCTNSLGIFLIASRYVKSWFPAFLAGLFFSANNFVFAQIDNPNTLGCFFGFLAIYFFIGFLQEKSERYFIYAVLLTAVQVYWAPYVFVFSIFIIFILVITHVSSIWKQLSIKITLLLAVLFCFILLPFLYVQFIANKQTLIDPIEHYDAINFVSLSLNDYLYSLPNNLFGNFTDRFQYWSTSTLKSAFIGVVVPGMALLGLLTNWRKSWKLLLIVLLGFFLAMGPCFQIHTSQDCFPSPLYPLYKTFGLQHFIRIPIRSFLIALMALSILSAIGLQFLLDKCSRKAYLILIVLISLFLIEQVPIPFYKYDSGKYLDYDTSYFEFLNDQPQSVILNLPSALSTFEGDRREYYYMYWQTRHKHNTLNGSLGFFTPIRLHNDSMMHHINTDNNLHTLIDEQDVGYVIFHKKLVYNEQEKKQLNFLKQSPQLSLIEEKGCCVFFKAK